MPTTVDLTLSSTSNLTSDENYLEGSKRYERGKNLGEGTFGIVFLAKCRITGLNFAVKRMKGTSEGVHVTAIRELKYLRELRHKNIIGLVDAYSADGALHMVLDLCESNLADIIKDKRDIVLTPAHIKGFLLMVVEGVSFMHNNFVLHRDLKPENLLIGEDFQLKIADFGLAMSQGTPRPLTAKVVTSWYKCPELCYGARHYSAAIDIWSVGCIFGEMIFRSPMFPGASESDIDQLAKIFNVLGTPRLDSWPAHSTLPNYVEFEPRDPLDLSELLRFQQPEAQSLLLHMLELNPCNRITAKEALTHPYFQSGVSATEPIDLPTTKPRDVSGRLSKRVKVESSNLWD